MLEFFKSAQIALTRTGRLARRVEPWSLDRNWHRSQAERHLQAHNLEEALPHLELSVGDADRRRAPAKQRVRLRLELADTLRRMASGSDLAAELAAKLLDASEKSAREAIALAAEFSDKEGYVNCLDALADILADRRDYSALEAIEQEAICLGAGLPHPDPLRMAKRVHRLAVARHKNGPAAAAIPALEKSIQLHEDSLGTEHPRMATLLFEIGCIFRQQAELARARGCFERALRLHEAQLGASSPEAIADLQQLAGTFEDAGDTAQAAKHYERCLARKLQQAEALAVSVTTTAVNSAANSAFVKSREEVALMEYSLAHLHAAWGNLARARELLVDSIGAFRREGGPRLAVAHEMLAQIEERSGRFHAALKELEEAAAAWNASIPGRPVEVIHNLRYRADILDQLCKSKEAGALREYAVMLETSPSARAQTA